MMYEHIVAKLKEAWQDKHAALGKHMAVQFNIWGEGHGALYMEIEEDGRIHIEPYEYHDRDALITTDAETILGIASGKIDPTTYGDVYVEGDHSVLSLLKDLSYHPEPEKTAALDKKAENVKESPKKQKAKKNSSRRTHVDAQQILDKAEDVAEKARDRAEEAAEAVKEKAGEAAEVVKDKAGNAAGKAREKAGSAAGKAREKAGSAAGKAREKAGSAAGKAREKAGSAAEKAIDKAEEAVEVVKEKAGSVAGKAIDKAEGAATVVKKKLPGGKKN